MLLYMAFLIVMVIRVTNTKFYLVEKDYYPQALKYQDKIDKKHNARALGQEVQVSMAKGEVVLTFQDELNTAAISGNVWVYRPSQGGHDLHVDIATDSNRQMIINTAELLKGRYILKIDYSHNDVFYYEEQTVLVE